MNEFRKRETGEIFSDAQVRASVPDMSLPGVLDISTLDMLGFDPVLAAPQPFVNPHQVAVRNGVAQDTAGNWVFCWDIQDLPPEVVAQNAAQAVKEFKAAMTQQVQMRLDAFAASRGYGDARTSPTVSIATYVGSVVAKFAEEAAYFRDRRDLTWAKLYEIEAAVAAGNRPAPTSYAEIEAELPKLHWPGDPEPEEEEEEEPVVLVPPENP